jgi:hypothetical protein
MLVVDANQFGQVYHRINARKSVEDELLSVDFDLPWTDEIDSHFFPWHKRSFARR